MPLPVRGWLCQTCCCCHTYEFQLGVATGGSPSTFALLTQSSSRSKIKPGSMQSSMRRMPASQQARLTS